MSQPIIDPQFNTINPEWKGKLVWRVEKFNLVPWNDYGSFYSGDCYITIHAYTKGTSKRVIQDIYFWIGEKCSIDEKGTAAIKAIELDDYLGGSPTQHRETQNHESDAFKKVFEEFGGIRYMDGGIDSGFKTSETHAGTFLYHIKGKKNPILQQVPAKGTSLNQGDVFILQSPGKYFLWIGKNANRMEVMKAANFLDGLRAKDSKSQEFRLENGETTPDFWEALGGETPIASANEAGDDLEHEKNSIKQIVHISNNKFEIIAEGNNVKPNLLKSDSMFIIRVGESLLVWIGKQVPKEEKRNSISMGMKFLEAHKLPDWVPIATMIEGSSSIEFDIAFA